MLNMRNIRFLAEWEESEGVLLALPDEIGRAHV